MIFVINLFKIMIFELLFYVLNFDLSLVIGFPFFNLVFKINNLFIYLFLNDVNALINFICMNGVAKVFKLFNSALDFLCSKRNQFLHWIFNHAMAWCKWKVAWFKSSFITDLSWLWATKWTDCLPRWSEQFFRSNEILVRISNKSCSRLFWFFILLGIAVLTMNL